MLTEYTERKIILKPTADFGEFGYRWKHATVKFRRFVILPFCSFLFLWWLLSVLFISHKFEGRKYKGSFYAYIGRARALKLIYRPQLDVSASKRSRSHADDKFFSRRMVQCRKFIYVRFWSYFANTSFAELFTSRTDKVNWFTMLLISDSNSQLSSYVSLRQRFPVL